MRVERIFDIQEVLKCLPFEREIRNKGREYLRESVQLEFIASTIDNPLFGYFIVYDNNDDVLGYSFAILNMAIKGHERVLLIRMYAKQNEVRELLVQAMTEWAKEFNIKIVQITTNKNIKVFKRRYGFKVVSVNMEREI